jgi:hypothetical protein
MKTARLSDLRTGRLYPPGDIPGSHCCYRLSRPQGHSAAEMIKSIEYPNFPVENRNSDLPALLCNWKKNMLLLKKIVKVTLISGFRRVVDVICGLLGDYTASCGNYLPTFRDNHTARFPHRFPTPLCCQVSLSAAVFPSWISTSEDGTDKLSRNVGK